MTIQQRKSPLVPTVLGAAAGAGGGALVGHLMTKPMTHDDIIKDIHDTTTFSNRVKEGAPEAATWQEVKNKADEVAGLKEKLAQAEKGVPTDPTIKSNLEKAQREYDNAIENLTEGKKKVASSSSKIEIVEANKEWKMTEDARKEYTQWYNDYKKALSEFNNDSEVKELQNAISTRRSENEDLMDSIVKEAKEAIDKNKNHKKEAKRITNIADYLEKGEGEDFIKTEIKKKNFHHLSDSELIMHVGENNLISTSSNTPSGFIDIQVKKADGNYAFARIKETELNKLKHQKTNNIYNSIKESLESYSSAKNKLDNLSREVNIDSSLLRQAGITKKTLPKGGMSYLYLSNNPKEKLSLNFKDFLDTCMKNSDSYLEDIAKLVDEGVQNLDEVRTRKGRLSVTYNYPKDIEKILTKYKDLGFVAETPKQLYDQLTARVGIGRKYKSEKEALENVIEGIFAQDSQFVKLTQELNVKNDKVLGVHRKKILGRYGKYLSSDSSTAKTETVAKMTKEQAVAELAKTHPELKEALEKAQKAAEGAERKVDDAAVKKAQEAFDAGEKSLKEMAESLGKKMTKGPNKWVAAGIGAAALGLATLLAVNSKNNKAQA